MTSARFAFSLLIVFSLSSAAHAACDPRVDPDCRDEPSPRIETHRPPADSGRFERYEAPSSRPGNWGRDAGGGSRGWAPPASANGAGHSRNGGERAAPRVDSSGPGGGARPLQPVRAYLRASEIPPAGAGAYGLVVFQSRPTSANRAKLKMVCASFVAFFPRQETASAPLQDQMVTVWPLDNPDATEAARDDCDYAVDHYDLIASQSAMGDAHRQNADFGGEGPYLVGWSPSNTRGVPDALVLVVDMSADNSQADINSKFLFWKNKIIDDPSAWRNGWSIERVRVAIHNFADEYGQSMLDAIKLIGGKQ